MITQILTIGDEILIGQIVDTNSAWMAQQLNLAGFQVSGKTSVGDTEEAILEGIDHAAARADIVLMTGGLGPTKDDLTKKILHELFGGDMVLHQETFDQIARYFAKIGRKMQDYAILHQATVPSSCTVLLNKVGTAPGMWFERDGKVYIAMPGVPFEMEYLMTHEVLPRLRQHFPARPIAHRTLLTVGEGESNIARRIEAFEDSLPAQVKLAYLPALGQVRLRLTGIWPDDPIPTDASAQLDALLDRKKAELAALLPDILYGYEEDSLQKVIGDLLKAQGKKIATAESCTGGHVAQLLTTIPGSSAYFPGGVVSYSNGIKTKVLNVQEETLNQHGAVSEETVREMVAGALELMEADVAVAISGIAGPDGGTPEKPVGTVWFAVGDKTRMVTGKQVFGRDRLKNIQLSATHALNMVWRFLLSES